MAEVVEFTAVYDGLVPARFRWLGGWTYNTYTVDVIPGKPFSRDLLKLHRPGVVTTLYTHGDPPPTNYVMRSFLPLKGTNEPPLLTLTRTVTTLVA